MFPAEAAPQHALHHPDWVGSGSAHFAERNSGYNRGKRRVETFLREGKDGPCALGLGGYHADVFGKRCEDSSIGKVRVPPPCSSTPWAEREMQWRPGRRMVSQVSRSEPQLISQRNPFVQRRGSYVIHHHATSIPSPGDDMAADALCAQVMRKQLALKRKEARNEVRRECAMVRDLEAWERDHVRRKGSSSGGQARLRCSPSAPSLSLARD
eukprot:TRINITY_DN19116_c0_g1_i2.p1 TRINITY_DN19116_c0_g1~~TRINITY_DN19116_c0_g1_i2.p1  ORF type:complete len:211 (+),score=31.10 TRINITY_DN19116_c0_g1_i2:58-690(+)